jgi:hypothetical protein
MEFPKSIDSLDMHVLKLLPLYYNSKEGKTIKVQEVEGRACVCVRRNTLQTKVSSMHQAHHYGGHLSPPFWFSNYPFKHCDDEY